MAIITHSQRTTLPAVQFFLVCTVILSLLSGQATAQRYQTIEETLINRTCDSGYDHDVAGFLDYWWFLYCTGDSVAFPAICLAFWQMYLLYILVSTTHRYLAKSLNFLTENLIIFEKTFSDTFMALSFIAADFFVSTAAVYHEANDIAVGGVVGGVFVNLTVGTALCVLLCKDKTSYDIDRRPFIRDIFFLLTSTLLLGFFWLNNNIQIWQSIILIVFSVMYLLSIYLGRYINLCWQYVERRSYGLTEDSLPLDNNMELSSSDLDRDSVNFMADITQSTSSLRSELVITHDRELSQVNKKHLFYQFLQDAIYDGSDWQDKTVIQKIFFLIKVPSVLLRNVSIPTGVGLTWSKPFFLVNCFASPLFLLVVTESTHITFPVGSIRFPIWGLLLILSLLIAVAVFFTSTVEEPPKYFSFLVFLNLVMSSSWLYMVGLELVSALVTMARLIGLSNTTTGILFLTIANSYTALYTVVKKTTEGFISLAFPSLLASVPLKLNFSLGAAFLITSIFSKSKVITFQAVNGISAGEWHYGGMNGLLLLFIILVIVILMLGVSVGVSHFRFKVFLGVLMVVMWILGFLFDVLAEVGLIFGSGPFWVL